MKLYIKQKKGCEKMSTEDIRKINTKIDFVFILLAAIFIGLFIFIALTNFKIDGIRSDEKSDFYYLMVRTNDIRNQCINESDGLTREQRNCGCPAFNEGCVCHDVYGIPKENEEVYSRYSSFLLDEDVVWGEVDISEIPLSQRAYGTGDVRNLVRTNIDINSFVCVEWESENDKLMFEAIGVGYCKIGTTRIVGEQ